MIYLKSFIIALLKIILVKPYNIFSILKDLLNPLLYSSKLRTIKKINGNLCFSSRVRVIFVIYQDKEIPFYIDNVLNVLKKLKINCTINLNEGLCESITDKLKEQCDLIIVRKNFGRDFAPYRDTILQTNLETLDKLIILNDSMFYFKKNLSKVFEQLLDKNYDVISLTENIYDKKWHLQSFLLSLDKKVLLNKNFIQFWKRYKCFNHRQHNINKGEILFSQKVLKSYYKNTKILYSLYDFIVSVEQKSEHDLGLFFKLLPHSQLKNKKNNNYIYQNKKNILLDIVEKTNITHSGAFIMPLLYNNAIIKKDIVFKNTFILSEALNGFISIGISQTESFQAYEDIKIRGNINNRNLLELLLILLGAK